MHVSVWTVIKPFGREKGRREKSPYLTKGDEPGQMNGGQWQGLNVGLEDPEGKEFLDVSRVVGKGQLQVTPDEAWK
jgi:hypothetical protein